MNRLRQWRWQILAALILILVVWWSIVDKDSNGPITAIATVVIAYFTATLWRTNEQTLEHNQTVERAYVKMSHTRGLRIDGHIDVEIEVKNWGRTPAQVTDVVLHHHVRDNGEPLPKDPPYPSKLGREPTHAFLVPTEASFFENLGTRFVDPEERALIVSGQKILTLIGYVDYTDRFGRDHRAGYARTYVPPRPGESMVVVPDNNLVFVTQDGYNYDHPRKPGCRFIKWWHA